MEISEITVRPGKAAQMLNISKPTMYQLLKRKDCDFAFQVGGCTLISVELLNAWVKRQAQAQSDNAQ